MLLSVAAITACGGDEPLPAYDVTVAFNDHYSDASLDAVTAIIHEFDPDADMLLQESWPPVLRVTVRTRRVDLCESLLARLYGREDIANLDCQPSQPERG